MCSTAVVASDTPSRERDFHGPAFFHNDTQRTLVMQSVREADTCCENDIQHVREEEEEERLDVVLSPPANPAVGIEGVEVPWMERRRQRPDR